MEPGRSDGPAQRHKSLVRPLAVHGLGAVKGAPPGAASAERAALHGPGQTSTRHWTLGAGRLPGSVPARASWRWNWHTGCTYSQPEERYSARGRPDRVEGAWMRRLVITPLCPVRSTPRRRAFRRDSCPMGQTCGRSMRTLPRRDLNPQTRASEEESPSRVKSQRSGQPRRMDVARAPRKWMGKTVEANRS